MTLGLLLGGAIGNMLDRLRLGYVVDFVDVGIGSTRFYTFNVADSRDQPLDPPAVHRGAPAVAHRRRRDRRPRRRPAAATPLGDGDEDPWDEDLPKTPEDSR